MNATFKTFLSLIILFPFCVFAQKSDHQYWKEGNKRYQNGQYKEAEILYKQDGSVEYKNSYNLGNAYFKQNKLDKAEREYINSVKDAENSSERANAYYNLGNIKYNQKNYKEAEEYYKKALKENPQDQQARENFVKSKNKRKEQQKKEQDNKKKQEQQQKDQGEQKQDEQGQQKDNNSQQQPQPGENNKPNQNNPQQSNARREEQQKKVQEKYYDAILEDAKRQENETKRRIEGQEKMGKKRKNSKNW